MASHGATAVKELVLCKNMGLIVCTDLAGDLQSTELLGPTGEMSSVEAMSKIISIVGTVPPGLPKISAVMSISMVEVKGCCSHTWT